MRSFVGLGVVLAALVGCAAPEEEGERAAEDTSAAQSGRGPREAVFARGAVDVVVFTVLFPRARVAALLPDALALGDVTSLGFGEDVYPVLFVVGRQIDVHAEAASMVSMSYDEAVVFVPEVRFGEGTDCVEGRAGPFLFSPAMYVADPRPWIGTSGYGYPKQLESLRSDARSFAVGDRLEVAFRGASPLSPAGADNRARIAELASAPILGMAKGGKGYVWSFFDWNLRSAEVSSLGVSGFVRDALGDGTTVPLVFDRPGLNDGIAGAFRLQTSWSLSKARSCPL